MLRLIFSQLRLFPVFFRTKETFGTKISIHYIHLLCITSMCYYKLMMTMYNVHVNSSIMHLPNYLQTELHHSSSRKPGTVIDTYKKEVSARILMRSGIYHQT